MYFLAACLIVVVLSFEVSFRRAWILSRNSRGAAPAQRLAARRRALWPAFCALICTLLVLIGFDHLQDELGLSAKANLMMLSASFFSGWFLGVIAGMDQD
ncbi:hypothetical protein ABIF38_008272 [Bradyrhizobium japonicum]|jgi:hypothetical protein|uniref:DUF3325 domain-containing protein n=1 Tax=Bradyrhizobium elkanii TaxID=29448 RepID=A0ABV4EVE1_BRAEL|nr:hypothetical protein [Bradyrhizobium elkanii]MBP2428370.1 hypothetical protein [Bradyrhizobium elkanii]MCP1729412.1 hypothetical protein [Bradyrhizobium elkanii]MCP1756146.1 hypothetical protein [Bradyrhizobium elkanii]MCP1981661.1 hypothetical protein [Bradyrhizobium elkanii]MCS3573541.1 hypothetical protein [Bradyrhizobium elkanii]